jgi:hypothetical protein
MGVQEYNVPKEKMKKADKVAKWREIRASNTAPPALVMWTAEDERELQRIANKEIDISETYLSRYAVMQKNNAVVAVLDFMHEEWESLKRLKEDNIKRITNASKKEGNNNDNGGGLGTDNEVNGGVINEEAA